jgi:hypothetical protein
MNRQHSLESERTEYGPSVPSAGRSGIGRSIHLSTYLTQGLLHVAAGYRRLTTYGRHCKRRSSLMSQVTQVRWQGRRLPIPHLLHCLLVGQHVGMGLAGCLPCVARSGRQGCVITNKICNSPANLKGLRRNHPHDHEGQSCCRTCKTWKRKRGSCSFSLSNNHLPYEQGLHAARLVLSSRIRTRSERSRWTLAPVSSYAL